MQLLGVMKAAGQNKGVTLVLHASVPASAQCGLHACVQRSLGGVFHMPPCIARAGHVAEWGRWWQVWTGDRHTKIF